MACSVRSICSVRKCHTGGEYGVRCSFGRTPESVLRCTVSAGWLCAVLICLVVATP